MAFIGQTTFNDGTDKYLQLEDDQIFATYVSGSNWTTLRVGFLWSVVDPGGTYYQTASLNTLFSVGMVNGNTSGMGSQTVNHWVGATVGTPAKFGFYTYKLEFRQDRNMPYYLVLAPNGTAGSIFLGTIVNNKMVDNLGGSIEVAIPTISGSTLRRFPFVYELSRVSASASTYTSSLYYLDGNSISGSASNQLYTQTGLINGITGSPNIIVDGVTLTKQIFIGTHASFSIYPPDTINLCHQDRGCPIRLYTWIVYKVS